MDPHDELVATKAWDSAVMRRLLVYARPHARLFLVSFAVLVTVFAFQLAGPWAIKQAIDGPIAAAGRARAANPEGFDASPFLRGLGGWAAAYLAIICAAAFFRYFEIAQLTRTGQAVIHDLRTHLFAHIQRLELSWFDRRPTGSLVTRVTSDIENLNELFTSGLIVLLFDLIKVVLVLAILFWVSRPLALLVLTLTPLLIVISVVFRGGARTAHRAVRARLARLNGYLQEVLSGVRVVQVFQREERVSARFGEHVADYLQANFRTIFLFAIFYPVLSFVTTGIQGATVWAGGGAIAAGTLTVGKFLFFWFLLQYLIAPIRELGERYNVLQSAFASAERIFEILDTPPAIRPPAEPVPLTRPFRGHVRFEGVGFGYGPDAGGDGSSDDGLVVADIDFEIRPGETVALVGATGAGKSTLVNLLLRFYDPSRGRVTVDGTDLRELDLEAFRAQVGLVLQEDYLFSGTVRENLVLDRETVNEETLARALETSAAIDVVERLADGLEAEVAERGATFSTGERELLAIARALAANPSLVVLDEATSSVDSATEARIEAATHRLLRGRSALVVAHRLSTVRRADLILVLHHGRIRERGTHEELLLHGGLYAKLHALQFRDLEDTADV